VVAGLIPNMPSEIALKLKRNVIQAEEDVAHGINNLDFGHVMPHENLQIITNLSWRLKGINHFQP
jgi:hypothetical protein